MLNWGIQYNESTSQANALIGGLCSHCQYFGNIHSYKLAILNETIYTLYDFEMSFNLAERYISIDPLKKLSNYRQLIISRLIGGIILRCLPAVENPTFSRSSSAESPTFLNISSINREWQELVSEGFNYFLPTYLPFKMSDAK